MELFKIGDYVREAGKAEGPVMKVTRPAEPIMTRDGRLQNYRKCVCEWMEAGRLKFGVFDVDKLYKGNSGSLSF